MKDKITMDYKLDIAGIALNLMVAERNIPYIPRHHATYHHSAHEHSWYELFYVEEGILHVKMGEKQLHLGAGSLFFVTPGTEHHTIIDEVEGAARFCFGFNLEIKRKSSMAERLAEFFSFSDSFFMMADQACRMLVRILAEAMAERDTVRAGSCLLSLLLTCASLAEGKESALGPLDDTESYRIYRIENICYSFFARKDFSSKDIAEELHLSCRQVERIMKKKYGCSFYTYVTNLRMREALALLKDGMEVASVAEKVGYSSLSAFYRAFRLYYGHSPSALLRMEDVGVE